MNTTEKLTGHIISHVHDKPLNMITVNNPQTYVECYRYWTDVILLDMFDIDGKFDHKLALEVSDAKKLIEMLQKAVDECEREVPNEVTE